MIPKQSFPKQCLTRLLVWLWSSPRAPPWRGGTEGAWSSENRSWDLTGIKGSGRGGEGSHTPTPATALHSHLLARRGPSGEGRELLQPPFSWELPSPLPRCINTSVDLPVLGPSQASQNQSPFTARGPDPCPQCPGLPPPRTPHEGRTSRVSKQGTEHTAWGGQGGGREKPIFL